MVLKRLSRSVLIIGAGLIWMAFASAGLAARGIQEPQPQVLFPTRPITIVVPWAPGGAAEIGARIFAEHLSRELNIRVDVVTRPGGTGATGTLSVKQAPADGYTILQAHLGPFAQVPLYLGADSQYDPLTDFHPLGQFSAEPVVFLAPRKSPWNTMADFVRDARANPGRFKVGAGGALSLHFLKAAMLFYQAEVQVEVVPYPGALAGVPDLLGGHLNLVAGNPTGAALYRDQLRAIGTLLDRRHPALPDVPTMSEQGFNIPPISSWAGYAVHANTPEPIKRRLEEAVRTVTMSRTFQEEMLARIDVVVEYSDPATFRRLWENSRESMRGPVEWLLAKEGKR